MSYPYKKITLSLCAALVLSLFPSCSEPTGISSAPAVSVSSNPAPVSSAADSQAVFSAADTTTSSEAASTSTATVDTKPAHVTVHTSDGQTAVLVLQIPADWTFDGYSTFTRDALKIAEVATVWKRADAAAPFTAEMTDSFSQPALFDGPSYPEGYGLVETSDRNVSGRLTRTYLYKTIPSDTDKAWYPHYMFHVVDDYVLQIHCYSFDQTADDSVFDAVLGSATLVFS